MTDRELTTDTLIETVARARLAIDFGRLSPVEALIRRVESDACEAELRRRAQGCQVCGRDYVSCPCPWDTVLS